MKKRCRYTIRVLYTARFEDVARQRGSLVPILGSRFEPSRRLMETYEAGDIDGADFRRRYLAELHQLYTMNPELFWGVIKLATGGADATLLDDWATERHAPRHVLAAALRRIASHAPASTSPRAAVQLRGS